MMTRVFLWLWTLGVSAGQDGKFPLPDDAARKDAVAAIREIFRKDYAKRDRGSRRALARNLLKTAGETTNDPVARYSLLVEARDIAAGAMDLDTCFTAIDRLVELYALDVKDMKFKSLDVAARAASGWGEKSEVAAAYARFAEDATRNHLYTVALDAARKADRLAGASRDKAFRAEAKRRVVEISQLAKEREEAEKGKHALAENPDDPRANLSVGRFLCFEKGDWENGLPHLAKGSHEGLRDAAGRELTKPQGSKARAAVADAWSALAGREKAGLDKRRYEARARTWYERALEDATGLLKLKIQKRLEALGDAASGPIDLLKLVNPGRDGVRGKWSMEGKTLVCSLGSGGSHLQFPYVPPAQYDLALTVERLEGTGPLVVGLADGKRQFAIELDKDRKSGLQVVDGRTIGKRSIEPAKAGGFLPRSRPTAVTCSVRRGSIRVTVGNDVVIYWKGDLKRLSVGPNNRVRDERVIFVGCWRGGFRFSRVSLRPVR